MKKQGWDFPEALRELAPIAKTTGQMLAEMVQAVEQLGQLPEISRPDLLWIKQS